MSCNSKSTFLKFCSTYLENFKNISVCRDPYTKQDITDSAGEYTISIMIMSELKTYLDKLDEFEAKFNAKVSPTNKSKNKIAKTSFKCNKKFCGYNLYIHEKSEKAKTDGIKINLSEVATEWNQLPIDTKAEYNNRANQIRNKKTT